MRDRRHRRPGCLSWSSRLFRVLICARLPGSLGSPDPVCPRRFRRDCRSPPRAVRRSLAPTASSPRPESGIPLGKASRERLSSPPARSSRELRSPSESSVLCPPSVSPPPAPSMGFAVPLRDITDWRPCPRASQVPGAFPSATFLTSPTVFSACRLAGLFRPAATSRVCSSGVFPRWQPRRLSPSLSCPLAGWRRPADDVATAATNRRPALRAFICSRIRCRCLGD
jgi:hypothetical protein